MPEFCTCGAQLPPDALFCHKCGKPQRELVAPEVHIPEHAEFLAPPAPLPLGPEDLPMNYPNPVAMRISFTAAILAAMLSWVPFLNVVLWLGAGYFAVFFYRRRTGHFLNVGAGLLMGWITGVMVFAIVAVLFTAFVIVFNASGGIEVLQSQFRNASDPRVREALQTLRSGSGIAVFLMQLFLFITCLSMVGGALGAKLVGRASTSSQLSETSIRPFKGCIGQGSFLARMIRPYSCGLSETSIWSFDGRVGRGSFWARMICVWGCGLVVELLAGGRLMRDADPAPVAIILYTAYCILLGWLALAAWVKRWHDLGFSGWMTLLNLTVIAIPFTLILAGCVRGTQGPNRYGSDPLGPAPDIAGPSESR